MNWDWGAPLLHFWATLGTVTPDSDDLLAAGRLASKWLRGLHITITVAVCVFAWQMWAKFSDDERSADKERAQIWQQIYEQKRQIEALKDTNVAQDHNHEEAIRILEKRLDAQRGDISTIQNRLFRNDR